MIAAVHIADLPIREAMRVLAKPPTPSTEGALSWAEAALCAPLRESKFPALPVLQLRRVALFSFWSDDGPLDGFEARWTGRALLSGWSTRLEPLRAQGAWPGLPEDLPSGRHTSYEGPAMVLTLGRLRPTQLPRFLKTSGAAERGAVDASGFLWGTAAARPPFVATCSMWKSTDSVAQYAYDNHNAPHPEAIAADRAKPFHRQSAFVRFRPYRTRGELRGRNLLPPRVVQQLQQ